MTENESYLDGEYKFYMCDVNSFSTLHTIRIFGINYAILKIMLYFHFLLKIVLWQTLAFQREPFISGKTLVLSSISSRGSCHHFFNLLNILIPQNTKKLFINKMYPLNLCTEIQEKSVSSIKYTQTS